MALDFASTVGARTTAPQAGSSGRQPFTGLRRPATVNRNQEEGRKFEFWINIGYVDYIVEDGVEKETFVSLNTRQSLDGIDLFDVKKAGSANMAMLRQKQNELHESFMEVAQALEPGQAEIVCHDPVTGIAVEIRRVKAEQEIPVITGPKRFDLKARRQAMEAPSESE